MNQVTPSALVASRIARPAAPPRTNAPQGDRPKDETVGKWTLGDVLIVGMSVLSLVFAVIGVVLALR